MSPASGITIRTQRSLGLLLLIAWLAIWGFSIARDQSVLRGLIWLPLWDKLSVDVQGNFLCSRALVRGENPYELKFGSLLPLTYGYPPATLWQFVWCAFMPSLRAASITWFIASSLIILLAVHASLRVRRELGLRSIDPVLALGLILFSSPVFFELERSNCNSLVLLHLVIACAALRSRTLLGDLIAAAALGLATWTKIYPFAAVPALLVFARPRAFVFALGFVALFAIADLEGLRSFWLHRQQTASIHYAGVHGIYDSFMHPLGAWWVLLWRKAGVTVFDPLPQAAIAAALLAPLFLPITRSILNLAAPVRAKLQMPFLFWVVSGATFLLPIANDYNLIFLPLALLCVLGFRFCGVSKSEKVAAVLFLLSLPWLQPFRMSIDPYVMTALKLCCLASAGFAIHARCASLAKGCAA
ncbi:MAG: DUF2029 domain-containing protein [Phycisphaeraceae bacterium]|nr:DUF2029 domain-containing protein [Phycisphaeraceae bacterium]